MILEVRTGSRLHFGLMELCEGEPHRYGGLGVMIADPPIVVRVIDGHDDAVPPEITSSADGVSTCPAPATLTIKGPEALLPKIRKLPALQKTHAASFPKPTQLEISQTSALHSGLGTGTQSACAVTTALQLWHLQRVQNGQRNRDPQWRTATDELSWNAADLSSASGRGLRSAIGLQGFVSGGLIWDQGFPAECSTDSKTATECSEGSQSIARPVQTVTHKLPDPWRVVTLRPREASPSISGASESKLIDRIAQKPNPDRQRMITLTCHICDLCDTASQFEPFTEALDEYMSLAGKLFAAIQGGPYSSSVSAEMAAVAERNGLSGVGQSSWGPTIFGFSESPQSAEEAASRISAKIGSKIRVCVTKPCSHGAVYRWT